MSHRTLGNDYVITVKAKQKLLYQRVCAITQDSMPVQVYVHSERNHPRLSDDSYNLRSRQLYVDQIEASSEILSICSSCREARKQLSFDTRLIQRTIEIFDYLAGIAQEWFGLRRSVRVQRQSTRNNKLYTQQSYYIIRLATPARQFAEGIRRHWGIENRLHGVKDVILDEDDCPLKLAHAPQNWGLIRTWAVNQFRLHGEALITKAQRRVAHAIDALFLLIR